MILSNNISSHPVIWSEKTAEGRETQADLHVYRIQNTDHVIALAAVDALLPVCTPPQPPPSSSWLLHDQDTRQPPGWGDSHCTRPYTRCMCTHFLGHWSNMTCRRQTNRPYRRPRHGILSSIHDKHDKHSRTPATPPSSAFLHRLPRGTLHPLSSSPRSLLAPPVLTVDYIPDHFPTFSIATIFFFLCAGEIKTFFFSLLQFWWRNWQINCQHMNPLHDTSYIFLWSLRVCVHEKKKKKERMRESNWIFVLFRSSAPKRRVTSQCWHLVAKLT